MGDQGRVNPVIYGDDVTDIQDADGVALFNYTYINVVEVRVDGV